MKLTLWERLTGKKWAHVKTMIFDNILWDKDPGKVYIHFFESNKGDRQIECSSSFSDITQDKVDTFVHASEMYNTRIVRWLAGRLDPEIPRYSQIGEEETANALRGKV